mmetsp:Transcript_972/g.2095  ORF Transcript_972/g.2095 Transcript_972/m.2095 type:complete len:89 (+) Transcript_972:43-309(+)
MVSRRKDTALWIVPEDWDLERPGKQTGVRASFFEGMRVGSRVVMKEAAGAKAHDQALMGATQAIVDLERDSPRCHGIPSSRTPRAAGL